VKIGPQYREPQEVGFWRWIEYHAGMWLECIGDRMARPFLRLSHHGNRMQWHAIDPDDEVPF
jgi:hypothetical protein